MPSFLSDAVSQGAGLEWNIFSWGYLTTKSEVGGWVEKCIVFFKREEKRFHQQHLWSWKMGLFRKLIGLIINALGVSTFANTLANELDFNCWLKLTMWWDLLGQYCGRQLHRNISRMWKWFHSKRTLVVILSGLAFYRDISKSN